MKGYILSIAAAVVVCEIIINIMPDGEIKKYLKVLAFIVISIMIFSPVVSMFTNGEISGDEFGRQSVQSSYYEKQDINIYKEYVESIRERNSFYNERE